MKGVLRSSLTENTNAMKPRKLADLNGKPVYRFMVEVSEPVGADDWKLIATVPVISHTSKEACALVRKEYPQRVMDVTAEEPSTTKI